MRSSINCPQCDHRMKFKPEHVGRKARCSKCQAIFRISEPSAGSGTRSGTVRPADQSAGAISTGAHSTSAGAHSTQAKSQLDVSEIDDLEASPVSARGLADEQVYEPDPLTGLVESNESPYEAFTDQLLREQSSGLPRQGTGGAGASSSSQHSPYTSYYQPRSSSSSGDDLGELNGNLVSCGVFLVIVGLMATILPLFGLQLWRLRNAGDLAPFVGAFLGLIGVAFIAAGTWRRPALAVASAAFSTLLVLGISIGVPTAQYLAGGGTSEQPNAPRVSQREQSGMMPSRPEWSPPSFPGRNFTSPRSTPPYDSTTDSSGIGLHTGDRFAFIAAFIAAFDGAGVEFQLAPGGQSFWIVRSV